MPERADWQAASERLQLYINEYTEAWDEKLAASAKRDADLVARLFSLMASAPDVKWIEEAVSIIPENKTYLWLRAVVRLLREEEGQE